MYLLISGLLAFLAEKAWKKALPILGKFEILAVTPPKKPLPKNVSLDILAGSTESE